MKQHPAAIEKVGQTFYLSEGEKQFLLACDIGEGLFFAGNNHVAMRVVASPQEHQLVTSKPEDVLAQRKVQTPPPEPISVAPKPKSIVVPKTPPFVSPAQQTVSPIPTPVPASHIAPPTSHTPPPTSPPLPPRFKSEIIMDNGNTDLQK